MPTDRAHLERLTEACEDLIAGKGGGVVERLRAATTRARIHLDHCEPDALTAGRAGYAAGGAANAGARP